MIKKLLLILLLLSVASPALAAKEYLYPATSFDATNWTGTSVPPPPYYVDIDDPWDTPNDSDYVSVSKRNQASGPNPVSAISAIQAGDTINYIVFHLRNSATASNVLNTWTSGANSEVHDGTAGTSYHLNSSLQLTTFNGQTLTIALLNAMTYTLTAANANATFYVSSLYIEIDYTPQATTTTTTLPVTTTTTT